ncbi:MAG: low temperature requirement protein A [Pyrinomonadaceae bacterium]
MASKGEEKGWWRPPRLRTDEEEGRERRVSWLELFYDLVFVVVVAELAHVLALNISLIGVLAYSLMFIAGWWLWIGGTYYNDRFETEDVSHRLSTFLQIIPVVALAAFVHDGLGKLSVQFALAYAAGRILILLLWLRGGWHNQHFQPVAYSYAVGFTFSAALWIGSIFVPAPWRFVMWAVGLVIDLITPFFTVKQQEKLPALSSSHLPERFGLFTIIVLGEAMAGVVRGIAAAPQLTVRIALTATLGIAIAFGLWWIYFDFVGRRFAKPHVAWKGRYGYLHLPLLMSVAAGGAGVQSVVASETDGLTTPERWLISVAVGLSLASIGFIEHSLPQDAEEPVNQKWSANLKIILGVSAPLLIGWTTLGTYALLGILLGFILIPVFYGTVTWFQSPISQKENEGTSSHSSVAEADIK